MTFPVEVPSTAAPDHGVGRDSVREKQRKYAAAIRAMDDAQIRDAKGRLCLPAKTLNVGGMNIGSHLYAATKRNANGNPVSHLSEAECDALKEKGLGHFIVIVSGRWALSAEGLKQQRRARTSAEWAAAIRAIPEREISAKGQRCLPQVALEVDGVPIGKHLWSAGRWNPNEHGASLSEEECEALRDRGLGHFIVEKDGRRGLERWADQATLPGQESTAVVLSSVSEDLPAWGAGHPARHDAGTSSQWQQPAPPVFGHAWTQAPTGAAAHQPPPTQTAGYFPEFPAQSLPGQASTSTGLYQTGALHPPTRTYQPPQMLPDPAARPAAADNWGENQPAPAPQPLSADTAARQEALRLWEAQLDAIPIHGAQSRNQPQQSFAANLAAPGRHTSTGALSDMTPTVPRRHPHNPTPAQAAAVSPLPPTHVTQPAPGPDTQAPPRANPGAYHILPNATGTGLRR
ncbi:hypothetical protein [Streptomyces bauhiniae]